ncbi:Uncharacterised protein [Mycobacterium tuberculosis]|uniref:Uncharacterized protein n=1 Tax=Mycobacterium tuberculosis TaxID=1773 RepID=A0A916LHI7_MYCTX|nr:Uncharacterised protein [Mycobacterium tuberculosis]
MSMATAGALSAGKRDDSRVPSSCSVGASRPWMAIWCLRRSSGLG